MANLTKSSGVSPPFSHIRSSPPSPVPPTIGAGVVSATVVGVAAAAAVVGGVVAAVAAVVGVAAALVALLLLLLSSPQATIAIVNAANPAATLIILICFPLFVTGCWPDLLFTAPRRCFFRRCRARCAERARPRPGARPRRPAS